MNRKQRHSFLIDGGIVILIALCIIGMISASEYKINEIFQSHRDSLLVRDLDGNNISEELAEAIVSFRPDTCRMIEVYSTNFDLILRMQFVDEHIHDEDIHDYPDLVELLTTHKEGHTTIRTEDEEEDVYFRWTEGDVVGGMCLTIVYMSRNIVKNIWIIDALGYIILILAGILLIRIRLLQHNFCVQQYQSSSEELQHRLLR